MSLSIAQLQLLKVFPSIFILFFSFCRVFVLFYTDNAKFIVVDRKCVGLLAHLLRRAPLSLFSLFSLKSEFVWKHCHQPMFSLLHRCVVLLKKTPLDWKPSRELHLMNLSERKQHKYFLISRICVLNENYPFCTLQNANRNHHIPLSIFSTLHCSIVALCVNRGKWSTAHLIRV